MRGVSLTSTEAGRAELESALGKAKADAQGLSADLFAVTGLFATNASLRRAMTDPARPGDAKQQMLTQLLGKQISKPALAVLGALVGGRWANAHDLVDATETLGVEAALAGADKAGKLEELEDQLFRFARTIGGDVGLRDAFSARTEGTERKAALVKALIGTKASPEALALATQAAVAPRDQRTEQVLEGFVALAAKRRQKYVAQVRSAVALSDAQRERIASALERIYGHAIQVQADVDPSVIGGLRIEVAGETIDGSTLSRLSEVQRKIAS